MAFLKKKQFELKPVKEKNNGKKKWTLPWTKRHEADVVDLSDLVGQGLHISNENCIKNGLFHRSQNYDLREVGVNNVNLTNQLRPYPRYIKRHAENKYFHSTKESWELQEILPVQHAKSMHCLPECAANEEEESVVVRPKEEEEEKEKKDDDGKKCLIEGSSPAKRSRTINNNQIMTVSASIHDLEKHQLFSSSSSSSSSAANTSEATTSSSTSSSITSSSATRGGGGYYLKKRHLTKSQHPPPPSLLPPLPLPPPPQQTIKLRDVPQMESDCDNFAQNHYHYLLESEYKTQMKTNFFLQTGMDLSTRATLNNWLIRVQVYLHNSSESLHLAIALSDYFLSFNNLPMNRYQLLVVAAYFVSVKIVERFPPKMAKLSYLTDHNYTEKQIEEFEKVLLKGLNFRLFIVTPINLLDHMLRASTDLNNEQNDTLNAFCRYLFDLLLTDKASADCLPSIRTAAAIFFARSSLFDKICEPWTQELIIHTGYDRKDLIECASIYSQMHMESRKSVHKAAFDKHSYIAQHRGVFRASLQC